MLQFAVAPIAVGTVGKTIAREIAMEIGFEMAKEIASRGYKAIKEFKGKGPMDKYEARNNLKMLEMKKYEIEELSEEYAKASKAQRDEISKNLKAERDSLLKKNKFTDDEIQYEQASGIIKALNDKAMLEELNDKEKRQLVFSKSVIERIKPSEQNKEMLIEEQTIKANIAGRNNKSKAQQEAAQRAIQIEIEARRQSEERIKAEGKEFDDNMKKKEEAMKSLAEFDERMRIASLDGEAQKQAQLLANYEKQKAEIETLHEAQLLYAEDDMEIKQKQYDRLLNMEATYQAEKEAISKEYAEIEAQRRQAEDEAARAMAEQRKREKEELRDLTLQASAAGMSTIAQLAEGHKDYATLYKTTAIGEAVINATQSILKTMAGTPFPFNIPLASAQAATAAVQVQKIASTKMYRGGMIPDMNTLIMANEQGREAILNPMAVRAIGGEAGVNALNRGTSNTYNNSRSSTTNINISTSILTQKAFRDEIEPVLRRAERRL